MSAQARLPPLLTRNLADSELEVVCWDGAERRLDVRVVKDIGPEAGTLNFFGVSHVNLPSKLTIGGIESGGLELLPDEYLDQFRAGDRRLDPSERAFVLHETWGAVYYVVAELLAYRTDA